MAAIGGRLWTKKFDNFMANYQPQRGLDKGEVQRQEELFFAHTAKVEKQAHGFIERHL